MYFFKHHFRMSVTTPERVPVEEQESEPELATEVSPDPPPRKKQRFEATYAEEAEWELPTDMAEYFVKQMKNFIKPAEIEEHIINNCPTPKNLGKVKLLDESFKELLVESGKKAVVDHDETLFNVQRKIWDILGPLLPSMVWHGGRQGPT